MKDILSFTETDSSFRDRIADKVGDGEMSTLEDLSDASGETLDAIGARYGVVRTASEKK